MSLNVIWPVTKKDGNFDSLYSQHVTMGDEDGQIFLISIFHVRTDRKLSVLAVKEGFI